MNTEIQALKLFAEHWNQQLNSTAFDAVVSHAVQQNPWFTPASIRQACDGWMKALRNEALHAWLSDHEAVSESKKVGLVLAGNLPFVGLHDLLAVLVSGHQAHVKLSSDDTILMRWMFEMLKNCHPAWANRILEVEKITQVDAVIATGSNNTSRYFEYYFKNIPHIIRKNRNAVAVVDIAISDEQLTLLGKDVFSYFGLGCRNVSKIYLPIDFPIERLMSAWEHFRSDLLQHNRYFNNFEYQLAMLMVNKVPHYTNNAFILLENQSIASPVSVLHFERYEDINEVTASLAAANESIQCIVSNLNEIPNGIAPGDAQSPELWDYADGVNTLHFLMKI